MRVTAAEHAGESRTNCGVRWVRRGLAMIAILLAAWLVVGYLVIVRPHVVRATHADAILVLGPELDPRLNLALRLARNLHIGELAISVGDTSGQISGGLCASAPPDVRVTCFVPDPYSTRGEARELGRLAAQRGWHNVIVIAPTQQVSRAHLLGGRCFHGTIQMVAAPQQLDLAGWVGQFVYQSAAFAKAFLQPTC